jgi:hypothetical protein
MYSEMKKNDILSQGTGVSAAGKEEKPNGEMSESPQINANERFSGHRHESKAGREAEYSTRSPKRKFPTGRNRRQNFQTKSRRISD